MEDHNEWMNEEDYETDENGEKLTHPLRMTYEDMEEVEGGGESSTDQKVKPGKKGRGGGQADKRKRSPSPPPKNSGKRTKKGAAGGAGSSAGAASTPSKQGASKAVKPELEDDYSRDFDDPPSENTLTEVAVPKVPVKKLESDFTPVKEVGS